MTALAFVPHNDDETLFAFYTILRHQAEVIVVLRSQRQELQQNGPTYQQREAETTCATSIAGVPYTQWTAFTDDTPDWPTIFPFMQAAVDLTKPEFLIIPAWELGGHEDHNELALIAEWLQGDFQFIRFLTYQRGYGRSTDGEEVVPTEDEYRLKLAALACYASQRNHPPTAAWFGPDQREFIR